MQSSSVDIFATEGNKSSMFLNGMQNMQIPDDEKLDMNPVEFLCQHYDIVPKAANLLNRKYETDLSKKKREELETESYNDIVNLLAENRLLPVDRWVSQYVNIIFADLFGYGVLESMLKDENVDEIMVVSHDSIYAEVGGKILTTPFRFPSVENAKGIVTRFISPLNKRLDASCPNVNAQLPDGSRLSATIAPLRANNEISITIRKFKNHVEPLSYYVEKYQSQTHEMAQFLEDAVTSKLSMLVSGGTGSGKTTLLNSLSIAIPSTERILTVEDTLELQLQQEHVESYQTIEPNMEGKGGFTMQQVIIEALRKRPDRIIVGECRGPEIVEMLNAMNTGHEGSLSTIHANSPSEMVSRASTMIRSNPSSAHLQERSIYDMLEAVNLIVQTNRLPDGSRRVTRITEVVGSGTRGYNRLMAKREKNREESAKGHPEDKLYLKDIFMFVQTNVDESGRIHGKFVTTGWVPYCLQKMRQNGFQYDESFFERRILMEV